MAGLLRIVSNADLLEQQRQAAQLSQQAPILQNLAVYIRSCFDAARDARMDLDTRMLKCLRQRLGQYEPDFLAQLQEQGGTQIYMLLTQTKCRGFEAWVRDIMLSSGEVPWGLDPTPVPELSAEELQEIMGQIGHQVSMLVQTQGVVPSQEQLDEVRELAIRKVKTMRMDEAREAADGMQQVMRDQHAEGNFVEAIDQFITDLATYPYAVLKGPVVTMRPYLSWGRDMATGKMTPVTGDKLTPWWSRVSPFDFYWEPGVSKIQNGYTVERHEMSRRDVAAMIGQPGYDEGSVRLVLHDYEQGMLNDWLDMAYGEWERRRLENRDKMFVVSSPAPVFKALEFNGSVSGRMLDEWGMPNIEDLDREYEINAWLIGRHVVRAVMNADPLAEKPYRVTSFNKVPGSLAGLALPELISDTQDMCNAAARAIANNMAVASGPQVEINIDRVPANEEITEVYPWKIWQTLNDPLGTTAPAVRFNQPTDNTPALMAVFEKFSRQSDEQSGIPAYTYGDTDIQGAGRTSSGLSMLMGAAGKGIRQVITQIDLDVIQPTLRQQYRWNMKFHDDDSIKGDADITPKGTASLVKEQLNLRRVEFLQATANPIDAQIVGAKGRAAILREVAKGLEMDVDKIIPSEDELEVLEMAQQAIQQSQPQQVGNERPPSAQMDQGPAARKMA